MGISQWSRGRAKQIVRELRQLAGSIGGRTADQKRRADFGVTELRCLKIEHERGQGAFHPGKFARKHHETRAGQLRRPGKIHHPERLADCVVLLGLEIEGWDFADLAQFDIGGLIRPIGGIVGRQVRESFENGFDLGGEFLFLGLQRLEPLLQLGDFRDKVCRLLPPALGEADLLGGFVAPALDILAFALGGAAALIALDDGGGRRLQPATRQTGVEGLGVFPDPTNVEHVGSSLGWDAHSAGALYGLTPAPSTASRLGPVFGLVFGTFFLDHAGGNNRNFRTTG